MSEIYMSEMWET